MSGCGNKDENQNIDKKIASEIKYLDGELEHFMNTITGNTETKYIVAEEETKVKDNESSSGSEEQNGKSQESSGESQGGSEGSSSQGGSSQGDGDKNVTIMSTQYEGQKIIDKKDWDEISNRIQNIYTSWAIIENDINTKENINHNKLSEINNNFDNLLIFATEQNEVNFINEIVNIYNNLVDIASEINYDNNKLNILKAKKNIYESYANVLQEDWESAKNNIELAKTCIQDIEGIENKNVIIIKNLIEGIDKTDKKIFFIKYSDVINELNYISD